jgi:phosphatidylserine/phosphatidylglycerophosphate/cardiolipin synthase-like enzyme
VSPAEFRQVLLQTLADRRLSRSENRALTAALADVAHAAPLIGAYRRAAFDLAAESLSAGSPPTEIIAWLDDVTSALAQAMVRETPSHPAEACFSPGDACVQRLRGLFQQAQRSADVCVFTITDDRLSEAILGAHARGVALRVLTDNDKLLDAGSDVLRLSAAGIATRVDASEYHMHHKFAIFDRRVLVTGSYNWTRSAAEYNEENMLVTGEPALIARFQNVFDGLWDRCANLAELPRP